MRDRLFFCIVVVFACMLRAQDLGVNNESLKNILKTTFLDVHPIKDDVFATLSDINYASNRLVSAAKDVYFEAEDQRSKGRSITIVPTYGSSNDVDFVVSCATNHQYWYSAAIGTICLLGASTNSIDRLNALMNCEVATNGVYDLETKKSYVISALLNRAMKVDVSEDEKVSAWNFSMSFVSNHVDTIMITDMALSRFDDTFQNSRRRLELLRFLQPRETLPSLQNYVNSEIGKLESLPEGSLVD